MRAIAILIILAVAGFFGYQYAVEGRGPDAAIGVLTGATAEAEAAAAAEAAEAAAAEAAAAEAAAAEAAAAQAAADLLTTEGFDADQVIALIADSDLGTDEKSALISAVTAAQNSPALLQSVLDNIRQALGE